MIYHKKKTPATAEPELTVKCGSTTVTAKPGVMAFRSDTIRLTGEQLSSSFAHSPDLREQCTQQSDRLYTDKE